MLPTAVPTPQMLNDAHASLHSATSFLYLEPIKLVLCAMVQIMD